MVYKNPKELLSEIKRIMDLSDIQMKELAIRMHKSPQSVSQIFQNSNPKCSTIFEICEALNLDFEANFIYRKDDTE